jgi:antitoxin component HigA of HigAB toxin-antitoxin module
MAGLQEIVDRRGRIAEILNRKRALSIAIIRGRHAWYLANMLVRPS